MQIEFAHGMKPKLIKRIALFVGICYLMGLLQHQVSDVLHTLSHSLEMPSSIISHDSNTNSIFNPHDEHNHDNRVSEHEHKLIDLVDSMLNSSNQNQNSEDVPIEELKVKKQLFEADYLLPKKYTTKNTHAFYWPISTIKNGHLKELDAPPRHSKS